MRRRESSHFSIQEGKIPESVCPCAVCPAYPILCPLGSSGDAVPVSSPFLLKALCDDGLAAASILVLLGSVWELTPAWCRVCRSLWLSVRRCKRPRVPHLRHPCSLLPLLFAPLCPSPHPLFSSALPSLCSESPCLHHGGHEEENLFTSGCSTHAAGAGGRS